MGEVVSRKTLGRRARAKRTFQSHMGWRRSRCLDDRSLLALQGCRKMIYRRTVQMGA